MREKMTEIKEPITEQDKLVLLQIIMGSRFTPNEWEQTIKPIVAKLQVPLK